MESRNVFPMSKTQVDYVYWGDIEQSSGQQCYNQLAYRVFLYTATKFGHERNRGSVVSFVERIYLEFDVNTRWILFQVSTASAQFRHERRQLFLSKFQNHDTDTWVFPKIMVHPNHPFVHRVFPYFHHPFWEYQYFWGNTHIHPSLLKLSAADVYQIRVERC